MSRRPLRFHCGEARPAGHDPGSAELSVDWRAGGLTGGGAALADGEARMELGPEKLFRALPTLSGGGSRGDERRKRRGGLLPHRFWDQTREVWF